MIAVRTIFYGFLVLLLTFALPGQGAGHPVGTPLDGYWKGPLKLPGGQLEVIFRLVKLSSGEYFATLDVPMQKVSRLAVTVTTRADTVVFLSAEADCRFTGRMLANGTQLQGTWQQPGFKSPLTLVHSALPTVAAGAKVRLTPPYREENVTLDNQAANARLAGMLTVPAGPGPFPAVVLLSDAGSQDRNGTVGDFGPMGWLADYLTRRGVAVLRFDDRGVGESSGTAATTTASLVSDAQAALNFLRSRPELDQNHVGLIGHGEGGNVALLAAAQLQPPAFVVGLAPYGLPGAEIALHRQEATLASLRTMPEQLAAAIKRQQSIIDVIRQTINNSQARVIVANILRKDNPVLDEATIQARATEMVSTSYRSFLSFDPSAGTAPVTCPVLLLYGSADQTLNVDANLAALTKALKTDKAVTTRKLPGVNHLFQPDPEQWPIVSGQSQPNFSPAAEEAIRAWIMAQVGK